MANPSSHAYRADIDGLRAIAVLSVLFFHAFPSRLPGGFVGVDIFFVISGFLISGIIFTGVESGRFSFKDFYSRRIRRIFPALGVMCAACLVFGWFSLMPAEFRQLGKHVLGGALFSSNFVLLDESGYFDIDSARKPLRHLWSLGIEEQFYLIWPALVFLFRRSRRSIGILLATLGLLSFGFNLHMTWTDRAMAYYLPFTRFWELMVGSGLAFTAQGNAGGRGSVGRTVSTVGADIRSIAGIVAIAVSLILINERRAFPGWWAVLVCGGAALVLSAGPAGWVNRRVLASKPFVRIGLISYPLYLWHWPLFAFASIMTSQPSIGYRVLALVASVLLAWATYVFVELPLRQAKLREVLPRITWQWGLAVAILAVIGGLIGQQAIKPVSAGDPRIVSISEATGDWEKIENETVPGSERNVALFFGDSHMEQYWPRAQFVTGETKSRRTVEFRTMGGCAPFPGIERRSKQCVKFVGAGLARAAEPDVDIVIFAAQWSGFASYNDYYRAGDADAKPLDVLAAQNQWAFDEFEQALAHLRQMGKRVIVLSSSPKGDVFNPSFMVDHSRVVPQARVVKPVSRAALALSFAPIDDRIRAAAQRAGADMLDPLDWFCDARECAVQSPDGRPVSKDGSHMCASVVRTRADALDQFIVLGR